MGRSKVTDRLSDSALHKIMVEQGHTPTFVPKKERKKRDDEESRNQRELIKWWEIVGHKKHGLPVCLFHSVPNGGFRNVITASIMKAEGQRRGVFDLKLNVRRGGFSGLWLEMKSSVGRLSVEQIEFQESVKKQGYATAVCRSWQDAVDVIEGYLT